MQSTQHKTDAQYSELRELLSNADLEWHSVLAYVGGHLITPSLYLSIGEKKVLDCLDDSVQEALGFIYKANLDRNQLVLSNFEHFCGVLNAIGVYPVPLKGVALLAEGIYPDSGERIVSDIDVLVKSNELKGVLAALSSAKYLQVSNLFDPISLNCQFEFSPIDVNDFRNQPGYFDHHIPPVKLSDGSINIEIHTRVCHGTDRMSQLLDELVDQDLHIIACGKSSFKRASRLFHLLHNFYHSQITDNFSKLQHVDYRHLTDVKYLLQPSVSQNTGGELPQQIMADAMQITSEQGVSKEFGLYLSQFEIYFGGDTSVRSSISDEVQESTSSVGHVWSVRLKRAFWNFSYWLGPRTNILFLNRWLRFRYGPVPLHIALYKYGRHQVMRLARLVLK